MMPYTGGRWLSAPAKPHGDLSYLSPSAAPFTADRHRPPVDPLPNPRSPSPCPDLLPTAPSLYQPWVEPLASYMDPGFYGPGHAGIANAGGFLVSDSAPHNIQSGNHFSSTTQLHPFTSDRSERLEEKYPGIYQKASTYLSSDFGSSVAYQPSLLRSMPDFLDKEPCPIPQPNDHYSAYDNYIQPHLPSCSTYPLNYGLPVPSLAASPEVCGVKKTVLSTRDVPVLENAFSLQYKNACRVGIDYFDSVQNEEKDPVGYQTAYKHCGHWSSSANGMGIMGNYPLSSPGEIYNVGEHSVTGGPVQPSFQVKPDLSLQASYSKVSPSEVALPEPQNNFTESPEVNNVVVDSPCWKGTPATHRPPFDVGSCSVMASHCGYVSEEQGTKRERCMKYKPGDDSANVVIPGQQGSLYPIDKTNESTVLCGNTNNHVWSTSEESVKEVSSHISAAATAHAKSMTKETQHGNNSHVNKVAVRWENLCSQMPMNSGQEHLSHCSPHIQENILKIPSDRAIYRSNPNAELIKSMYNLSVILLSTFNGGNELKEPEQELIQCTIQNLNSLSPKRIKAALKVDDVTINHRQSKLENTRCNGKPCQAEKLSELVPGNIGTDFKTSLLQNLSTEENIGGDTKDAHMLVYKNLWIEAEACMCKLKYELQLARMEHALKCHSQQTGAAPIASQDDKASTLPKSTSSSCIGVLDDSSKQQNHVKESIIYSAALLPEGGDTGDGQSTEVNRSIANEIDAGVFAQLKVLKSPDDNICSFREDNSEQQQETSNNNKTYGIDDTVAVKMGISRLGDNSIYSLLDDMIKKRLESFKNNHEGTDGAVVATLKDFMSCNNNTSSLDEDFINKEQIEGSRDKADVALKARLKVLMCCNDNINSSDEDNTKQRQAASHNKPGQLEDVVMDRLQILKNYTDNTSSILEGRLEDPSDDWVGPFRKHSGDGALDGLTENIDLLNDVKCTSPSDEVNGKAAVQHIGAFLEEAHVCPVSVEPASLRFNDEQIRHSSSDWEHVLKEDFFLPGNPSK